MLMLKETKKEHINDIALGVTILLFLSSTYYLLVFKIHTFEETGHYSSHDHCYLDPTSNDIHKLKRCGEAPRCKAPRNCLRDGASPIVQEADTSTRPRLNKADASRFHPNFIFFFMFFWAFIIFLHRLLLFSV